MTETRAQFSDAQATDEAVLLLVRKLRRLHPAAYADLMTRLPDSATEALHFSDLRADTLRAYDQRNGISRMHVSKLDEIDEETSTPPADLYDSVRDLGCVYHKDDGACPVFPSSAYYRVQGDVWCQQGVDAHGDPTLIKTEV